MEEPRSRERYIESLFTLVLAVLFAAGVYASRGWPWKTALFPMVIGVAGSILAAILALWIGIRGGESAAADDTPGGASDIGLDDSIRYGEGLKRTVIICLWILGILAGTWLLGQPIALPLFVFLYLKVGSGEGWFVSIAVTLAIIVFLIGLFDSVIHVSWYEGELFRWLGIEVF
jgi:hypothetical protein